MNKNVIRDKMIEILCTAHLDADPRDTIRERYAYAVDLLIEAGTTIQRWTPIEERLPTINDANADNCVLAIHKACKKRYFRWRTVVDNPFDFTHWMPVPDDLSN